MDDVKVSIGLRPDSASNAEARAVNFTEEQAGPCLQSMFFIFAEYL